MREDRQELSAGTFWYFLAFAAGLYCGVSFYNGALARSFTLAVPPALCLAIAPLVVGQWSTRTLVAALVLYIDFLLSFALGYALASAGFIRFFFEVKGGRWFLP